MLTDFYELTMANGLPGQRLRRHHLLFRHVLPEGAGQRRLRHHGRGGAAGGLPEEPALYRGGPGIPALQAHLPGGVFRLPAALHLCLRRVGRARGHPHLPRGNPSSPCGGPAIQAQFNRDHGAFVHQPPEPHRHQDQPHRPGRPGPGGDGNSAPAGPRLRRGGVRRPGGLHRGLRRHGLHPQRPDVRRARPGHHGPQLGAALRQRVRGLQGLRRRLSQKLRAPGGYL